MDIRSMLEYTGNDTVTCLACFEHSILLKAQFAQRSVYPVKDKICIVRESYTQPAYKRQQADAAAGVVNYSHAHTLKLGEKAHSNAVSMVKHSNSHKPTHISPIHSHILAHTTVNQ